MDILSAARPCAWLCYFGASLTATSLPQSSGRSIDMDYLNHILLVLLLSLAVSGLKMGRSMRLLFRGLKSEDPPLWEELAQPYVSAFDTAAYLRANKIIFAGNERLATHKILSSKYAHARKWFYIFQGTCFTIFVLLTIQAIGLLNNVL